MKDIKIALISLKQEEKDMVPPIGLVYLATFIEKKKGIKNIKIIDGNFENIKEKVQDQKPDLIGITAMTIRYGGAISLAEDLKTITKAPIIIGGVHISTLPVSFSGSFDIGVIGEGEETFSELVDLYKNKKIFCSEDLRKIKGLIFYDKGKLEITEPRPLVDFLDNIPIPDFKYINKKYFEERPILGLGQFRKPFWVITSRGCPFRCPFCSTSNFWKRVRFHSPEYVVRNIKEGQDRYGANHIIIMDDLFTINKERVKQFISIFKKEGIIEKLTFTVQARANTIDGEMAKLLKTLNVKIVQFGFESGSKNILAYLKGQNVTPEINLEAIKLIKKQGIKVWGSFMLGNPGETLEDMKETANFIKKAVKLGADYIFIFVSTPLPATNFWEVAKRKGKVKDNMDFNKFSLHSFREPLLLEDSVNQEEFAKVFMEIRRTLRPLKYKMVFEIVRNNLLRVSSIVFKNPSFAFSKVYRFIFKR